MNNYMLAMMIFIGLEFHACMVADAIRGIDVNVECQHR